MRNTYASFASVRLSLIHFALGALQFAQEAAQPGNAAAGGGGGSKRAPQTFRVDLSKAQMGTKSKAQASGDKVTLPAGSWDIQFVEHPDVPDLQICKVTVVQYGRPIVKDAEQKDAANGYKLTGKMTKRLSLATTVTGRPIMTENAEGDRVRQIIDIPGPDGETYQFALIGKLDVYGKLTDEVVKRSEREANQQ